jgi:hypothetical protein
MLILLFSTGTKQKAVVLPTFEKNMGTSSGHSETHGLEEELVLGLAQKEWRTGTCEQHNSTTCSPHSHTVPTFKNRINIDTESS